MKENKNNIIAAIILGVCLIIASVIYAYSTRYEIERNGLIIVDKWTGEYQRISEKN